MGGSAALRKEAIVEKMTAALSPAFMTILA